MRSPFGALQSAVSAQELTRKERGSEGAWKVKKSLARAIIASLMYTSTNWEGITLFPDNYSTHQIRGSLNLLFHSLVFFCFVKRGLNRKIFNGGRIVGRWDWGGTSNLSEKNQGARLSGSLKIYIPLNHIKTSISQDLQQSSGWDLDDEDEHRLMIVWGERQYESGDDVGKCSPRMSELVQQL